MSNWTLFSNHGHVLLFLSMDPDARLRDIASSVGITERAVQTIIRDLQDGGFITVSRRGRRNRYRIHARKSLRHDLEAHCTVGQLTRLMKDRPDDDVQDAGEVPEPTKTRQRVPRRTHHEPDEERLREPAPAETSVPVESVDDGGEADAGRGNGSEREREPVPEKDGEQGSLF